MTVRLAVLMTLLCLLCELPIANDMASAEAASSASLPDWSDYAAKLSEGGAAALEHLRSDADAQERQEANAAFAGAISAAYLMEVYSDPDYPEFVPMWNSAFNVMGPVPDTVYSYTRINGAGKYRITGFRNTARYVEISINRRSMLEQNKDPGQIQAVDLDSLKLNPDTSFELILSQERPLGYTGNWIKIDPEVKSLLVRSQSYDWANEKDGVLAIERLDVPVQRPRRSAADIAASLSRMISLAQMSQAGSYGRINRSYQAGLINNVEPREYAGKNWVKAYLEGIFDLQADDAIILETEIPKTCRYWSAILLDLNKSSLDWMNHQSSLNGFQAQLNEDGKFRAVIALSDPGVPNWLDPAGHKRGAMQVRWDKCDSAPKPTFRKVPLDEVRSYLPASTPVISAAARTEALRARRLAAQMRRKW